MYMFNSTISILQDASLSADSANNPGYLVLMKCSATTNGSADDACIGWTGDTIYVKPTAETTISLSQIEVRPGGGGTPKSWLLQLFWSSSSYPHFSVVSLMST